MIYSLGIRTSVLTNGAASLEILASATDSYALLEIMVTNAASVGQSIGLGRAAAIGQGGNAALLALENTATVGETAVSNSWTAGPTQPARFHRRGTLAATIGAGLVWTFLRGLIVPAGGSIVLWNLTAGSPLDVSVIIDE